MSAIDATSGGGPSVTRSAVRTGSEIAAALVEDDEGGASGADADAVRAVRSHHLIAAVVDREGNRSLSIAQRDARIAVEDAADGSPVDQAKRQRVLARRLTDLRSECQLEAGQV